MKSFGIGDVFEIVMSLIKDKMVLGLIALFLGVSGLTVNEITDGKFIFSSEDGYEEVIDKNEIISVLENEKNGFTDKVNVEINNTLKENGIEGINTYSFENVEFSIENELITWVDLFGNMFDGKLKGNDTTFSGVAINWMLSL